MYLSNLAKEWSWEKHIREKKQDFILFKTSKQIKGFKMVIINYCMAFIQQLYKTEVHWGTLREKLISQIPCSFQNPAREDGIWEVLNHTL